MITPFPKFPSFFFFFFAISSLIAFNTASYDDPVRDLLALQSKSKSGVIHLNDQSVSKFLTSVQTPRPYSILLFFDALHLHHKPDLHLREILREFSILASSYIANNQNPSSPHHAKLFFCRIEFKESSSTFSLFGVDALPHLRLIAPNQQIRASHQMNQGDLTNLAESIAQFIESKSDLVVGPIRRPPRLSRNRVALFSIVLTIWFAYFVKRIIAGDTIFHDQRVWLAGAVFVYFFSVSGTMHNIIRKVPMYLVDPNNPRSFIVYYQGSGTQLGLEGFFVGFLFTIVVKRVVQLKNWKTGYSVHGYWPSRWR
ncbi:putative dolichyl-diphosphooligosaccharide--protein glycosyltransferase subunit 3B [Senna tora]|uniref:Putative dolichyl-diphosphooligosaccharide--protein glycosyltransferase subunit 3B n=1 Tax=Senna tora TaxID=362788 RepID=A0A835CIT1_9FABA|nr:putative dolichyl-diphosphooligosaccharide--protein glycosyltransferase subunit 3B [Senna tora]